MPITHLLNRSAEWKRDAATGVKGRFVESLAVINPELPCRLQIAGTSEKVVGGSERAEATHVLFTDPGVVLVRGDWLFIDGVRYKMLAGMPPSRPDHHLKWQLREEQESVS